MLALNRSLFLSGSESESDVTTDGQSASLSWYKAPIRGLRSDFYFRTEYGIRLTVTFLIPWGALSDERTGLSFVCAAGPCQRSLYRVRVPWDLRPYFTVSGVAPVVFKITPRHGLHRKHIFPYCCVFAVACLSIRCLGMGFEIPLFYCCVTQEPTVYQELVFAVICLVSRCPATAINIRPIVELAYARKCLSCRFLAMHVAVLTYKY
jgi:hypothetical protein